MEHLSPLIKSVTAHENIEVFTNADLTKVEGFVGNFDTTFSQGASSKTIRHGVAIIATGASEHKPDGYLYGKDPRVVTGMSWIKSLSPTTHLLRRLKPLFLSNAWGRASLKDRIVQEFAAPTPWFPRCILKN